MKTARLTGQCNTSIELCVTCVMWSLYTSIALGRLAARVCRIVRRRQASVNTGGCASARHDVNRVVCRGFNPSAAPHKLADPLSHQCQCQLNISSTNSRWSNLRCWHVSDYWLDVIGRSKKMRFKTGLESSKTVIWTDMQRKRVPIIRRRYTKSSRGKRTLRIGRNSKKVRVDRKTLDGLYGSVRSAKSLLLALTCDIYVLCMVCEDNSLLFPPRTESGMSLAGGSLMQALSEMKYHDKWSPACEINLPRLLTDCYISFVTRLLSMLSDFLTISVNQSIILSALQK